MLPSRHIIVSLPLAIAVGSFTQSALAGLLCLFSGVLIDADHLIEYIIHYGLRRLNFKKIYWACVEMAKPEEEGGAKKLHLFFHALEICILLWIGYALSKNFYLLSIALGYTGHLIMDIIGNSKKMKPLSYFITLRAINGFNTGEIARH